MTASRAAAAASGDYEQEALELMRRLAREGYTPRATAQLLAARKFVTNVSSLAGVTEFAELRDPETPTTGYTIGAFDVGRGLRGGTDAYRHGQRLLDGMLR